MWLVLLGYFLLLQRSLAFYENMFAYFNTPDCPEGWKKQEGGAFLIGQEQNKQNLQLNQDGTYTFFTANYVFGQKGGSMRTTLSINNMPSHHHDYQQTAQGLFAWKNGNSDPFLINQFMTNKTSDVGGNQSFNIMPEYYVATLCMYTNKSIDINKLLSIQAVSIEQIQKAIQDGQQSITSSNQKNLNNLDTTYQDKISKLQEYGAIDLSDFMRFQIIATVGLVVGIMSFILNFISIFQYKRIQKDQKMKIKNYIVPNNQENNMKMNWNQNQEMNDAQQQTNDIEKQRNKNILQQQYQYPQQF